ncbi:hypothetical protein [Ornithinibacillus sp. 179-J 7C1 HS]|uniref:hypothetical protein n=1 Tax=Ornithinibacillus sp. 179-J 7C1 HS TaxID=3142384 RepID=UPI00399FC928
MGNVILVDLNRVNVETSDFKLVDSVDRVGAETVLMDLNSCTLSELVDHRVYAPASKLELELVGDIYVYHELAVLPFFQEIRGQIEEDGGSKGVFRFRRVFENVEASAVISSDLCVLESIFDIPENMVIKRSREGVEPSHIILMIHYKGVIAHVEYTYLRKELVEIEWSGVGKLIEFHSDDLTPMKPKLMPLQYRVDSIIKNAKEIDSVIDTFMKYQRLIGGEGK